ncbi:FAM172 family protein homolog CG10038 [Drosophila biarmipes]|uniref:FAM172 family protein homolog CG10038 n=1 Tax=Drosophila biarmipes TaxID=125945 RepID=UPI001CDA68D2|nr:FAM172 family protein homolog CG10038 [Drosophila biarmipes]
MWLRFPIPMSAPSRKSAMSDSPSPARNSQQARLQLKKFGYAFDEEGVLRKIDPATETVQEAYSYDFTAENYRHYRNVIKQIPEIAYDLLEKSGLSRTRIPFDEASERSTIIFSQPSRLQKSKKLLVLTQGCGLVSEGQSQRSLIIYNSLDHGSQISYVRRAQQLGYDLLVTNANDCTRFCIENRNATNAKNVEERFLEHSKYVWENIVMPSDPESVALVAHSYGSRLILDLVDRFSAFFRERVFAIAFTDANMGSPQAKNRDYLCEVSCDWVASQLPLDTPISHLSHSIRKVSAGHPQHEGTSRSAIDSIIRFIEDKCEQRRNQ